MKNWSKKIDEVSFGELSFIKNPLNYQRNNRRLLDEESIHSRINISELNNEIFKEPNFTPINSTHKPPIIKGVQSFNRKILESGEKNFSLTKNFDNKIDQFLKNNVSSFGFCSINNFDDTENEDDSREEEKISNFSEELGKEEPSTMKKKIKNLSGCQCSKSRCVKKYCPCYSKGNKCLKSCKCSNCLNMNFKNKEKKEQKIEYKQKPKKGQNIPKKYDISCNCKNSKCIKFYCRCFREGLDCNKSCNCLDCENNRFASKNKPIYKNDFEEERLYLGKRKKPEEDYFQLTDELESDSILSGFEELVNINKSDRFGVGRSIACGVKKIKMNLLNHINFKVEKI